MATIIIQGVSSKSGKNSGKAMFSQSVTVATVPDRYHYATVAGIARTFERVGADASNNPIFRDQKRY